MSDGLNGDSETEERGRVCIDLILYDCAQREGRSMKDLTVLAPQHDPYRMDTPSNRRDASWFKRMVDRFVGESGTIHLRGLHYRISSAVDVEMPNGKPYINSEGCWNWLQSQASRTARWLDFVPFERIVDERNEAPLLYIAEPGICESGWCRGDRLEMPWKYDEAIFTDYQADNTADAASQPYRIIFFGEKTSLKEILLPFVARVYGELILPTGEASDTLIAGVASRAAADTRQAVVLYFSDFDPSGHQMAISVARKLQALCDMRHPNLEIQLHPVALTLKQVKELNLPSTPLKETEKRGDKWRAMMGYEQVEIDALIALNPSALREIVLDALQPFFDFDLAKRTEDAVEEWNEEAEQIAESRPEYSESRERVTKAFEEVKEAIEKLHDLQDEQYEILKAIELPELEVPEPELSKEPPPALFDSTLDYVEATDRLKSHKRWENQE